MKKSEKTPERIIAAIRGEAPQCVSYDQMRTDLRVILAAFESAESGKTVKL